MFQIKIRVESEENNECNFETVLEIANLSEVILNLNFKDIILGLMESNKVPCGRVKINYDIIKDGVLIEKNESHMYLEEYYESLVLYI